MGALKHALIPFFTLLHLLGFYKALDPKGFVEFCGLSLAEDETQTDREVHLIGTIMSFHLAMALVCFLGSVYESAHFRGVVIVWEVIPDTSYCAAMVKMVIEERGMQVQTIEVCWLPSTFKDTGCACCIGDDYSIDAPASLS